MSEVPLRKGEMGCVVRYLMILGRTFLYPFEREGWDVGRDEENVCCWFFYLKVERSPRRFLEWESAAVVLEEFS